MSDRPDPVADHRGPNGERPVSDLVSELTSDMTVLFRKELELAKIEVRQELSAAGKAAGLLAGGAILALVALMLLAHAASWGLAEVLPVGLAFLIVAVVIGVVAAVLALLGRNRLRKVQPVPQQAVETTKEDIEWAKHRTT